MKIENDLSSLHCKPFQRGASAMNREDAATCLTHITDWNLIEGGKAISRRFEFKGFYETMAFINAMAWISSTQDHHPDFSAGYKHCLVNYTSHAIGGLSENDFICAAKLNNLLSI